MDAPRPELGGGGLLGPYLLHGRGHDPQIVARKPQCESIAPRASPVGCVRVTMSSSIPPKRRGTSGLPLPALPVAHGRGHSFARRGSLSGASASTSAWPRNRLAWAPSCRCSKAYLRPRAIPVAGPFLCANGETPSSATRTGFRCEPGCHLRGPTIAWGRPERHIRPNAKQRNHDWRSLLYRIVQALTESGGPVSRAASITHTHRIRQPGATQPMTESIGVRRTGEAGAHVPGARH
jgi:hypothetical protein